MKTGDHLIQVLFDRQKVRSNMKQYILQLSLWHIYYRVYQNNGRKHLFTDNYMSQTILLRIETTIIFFYIYYADITGRG